MDPQTQLYLRYYSAQSGGSLPTFSGARRGQYGAGLGDILRGIFRTILPIAAHGASTFLNETLKAKESGSAQSWGAAAKSALGSTAENVVTNSLQKLKTAASQQSGSGGRRLRRQRRKSMSNDQGDTPKGYKKKRQRPERGSRRHEKKIKFLNF